MNAQQKQQQVMYVVVQHELTTHIGRVRVETLVGGLYFTKAAAMRAQLEFGVRGTSTVVAI